MQGTKYKQPNSSRNSKRKQSDATLPIIPDKRYFTIGEVGNLCGVKPHVLRYWEQEFPQIKPVKRRGNRRYYQHDDVLIIRQIRVLLYENGFTIDGALAQLNSDSTEISKTVKSDAMVKKVIADLESILQKLKAENISKI
jgi:DNA-binding transcriptional MerR regulator